MDDVIHYIGLLIEDKININELSVGYCIAKIDSFPQPFLLKPTFFRGKRRKKMKSPPQIEMKKNCSLKDSDKVIVNTDDWNPNHELTAFNLEFDDNILTSMWNIVNTAVDYYLMRKYEKCSQEIFRYWKCVQNFFVSNNKIFTTTRIHGDFQDLEKFVDAFQKKKKYTPDELQFILNCFKNFNIKLHMFRKSSRNGKGKPILSKNLSRTIDNDIISIDFHHLTNMNIPEKFFSLGKTRLPQSISNKVHNFFQSQGGNKLIEIDSFLIFLVEFEISSVWSKTGRVYLEYTVFIDKSKHPGLIFTNSIQTMILDFISSLEQNQQSYPAFYLTNKKYLKRHEVLIKDESIQFKLQLKTHFLTIFQEVANQVDIKKPNLTRNNIDQYHKLNNLIQSLILDEKDPIITNTK